MTRGRRILRFLASTAAVGAISLLLLEAVCRLLDPIGISYYPETARYMDTLVLEEPIGYRNRPNLRGEYFGVPVSVNALGLRDREVSADVGEGEFRVAVLGDSFPFGIGVSYEDSIPARMESVLQESAPPGVRIRTLNFGVPSYNSEQELLQLETLAMPLRPRAVMLLFALNDIYPKMWVFEKRRALLPRVAQRSYALSFLFAGFRAVATAGTPPESAAGLEDYRPDHPRWLAIDRSITEMHRLCRARGVPFVVFTYDEAERAPVAMVRAIGEREGFPVVNIVPWRDRRWLGQDPRRYANSVVDGHPNPQGCEIYARLFAESLISLGAVPAREGRGGHDARP